MLTLLHREEHESTSSYLYESTKDSLMTVIDES